MTFVDAKQMLNGSPTAATDYFKSKTTDKLTAAFRPEVDKAINDVGVTQQYKELVGHFKTIPFSKSDLIDIDRYVVVKSLDGLFVMLAEEEWKIRRILPPELPISSSQKPVPRNAPSRPPRYPLDNHFQQPD